MRLVHRAGAITWFRQVAGAIFVRLNENSSINFKHSDAI